MEHTNRYTVHEGDWHPEACYTGHANDRLRTGMTPKGREAWRRERVAGVLQPGPVARGAFRSSFRDGIVGGEGRGIGRKEAGFLYLEIVVEVHLRLFENLLLQAIVFRLL